MRKMGISSAVLIFLVLVSAVASAKDCLNKSNSKLICYYSKIQDVDSCHCSHVILPANSDVKSIDSLREKLRGVKILLTVHEFNEGLVSIVKNAKIDGLELNLRKLDSKSDISDFISTVRSKLGSDLYLVLSVPPKNELLAKYFDFKALSKNTDLFILQTSFLGANKNVTFHPSRLSGLWDMQNADSVVDLVSGLGAPVSKLVLTAPVQAFHFTLQDEKHTAPGSPALDVATLTRDQLCNKMSANNWTLERDQDQAGPYIFRKNEWIAFDDAVSIDIKAKYSRVRGLAGLALKDVTQDGGIKCGGPLLEAAFNGLSKQARAPRGAVLHSLEREILERPARQLENIHLSPYRISRVIDVEGKVHVIRQDTRTEFECSRQGYFVHPRSCGRFYRCVKFDQLTDEYSVFEFDCPAGLAFDSRVEVCVWPGSLPHASACSGSSEIAPVPKQRFVCPGEQGYYADPENCRWFFACLDHGQSHLTAYEFRCPFGLVFDQDHLLCEWPWLVPKCASGTASSIVLGLYQPSVTVYGGHGAAGTNFVLDQYDGLGNLGRVTLGGVVGPIEQPVEKVYSSFGGHGAEQSIIGGARQDGILLGGSQSSGVLNYVDGNAGIASNGAYLGTEGGASVTYHGNNLAADGLALNVAAHRGSVKYLSDGGQVSQTGSYSYQNNANEILKSSLDHGGSLGINGNIALESSGISDGKYLKASSASRGSVKYLGGLNGQIASYSSGLTNGGLSTGYDIGGEVSQSNDFGAVTHGFAGSDDNLQSTVTYHGNNALNLKSSQLAGIAGQENINVHDSGSTVIVDQYNGEQLGNINHQQIVTGGIHGQAIGEGVLVTGINSHVVGGGDLLSRGEHIAVDSSGIDGVTSTASHGAADFSNVLIRGKQRFDLSRQNAATLNAGYVSTGTSLTGGETAYRGSDHFISGFSTQNVDGGIKAGIGGEAILQNQEVQFYGNADGQEFIEDHGAQLRHKADAQNRGIAGNIDIIGGGFSAVKLGSESRSGVQLIQHGANVDALEHVTPVPVSVTPSSFSTANIPVVTSVPVPAIKTATGFDVYKGGVVANVPELQYKLDFPKSINNAFYQAQIKGNSFSRADTSGFDNASSSLVGYASSTAAPLLAVTEGYTLSKPSVAFVDDQVDLKLISPSISTVKQAQRNGYDYSKSIGAVSFVNQQSEPIVHQQVSLVQPTESTILATHSTPATLLEEDIHAIQPVIVSQPVQPSVATSYNYHQANHKSQGYVYNRPSITLEKTSQKLTQPSLISVHPTQTVHLEHVAPVQVVQQPQVISSYNYDASGQKSQGYIYKKPNVIFEEVRQKPVVVSTFGISQSTTPVPLDTIVPLQPVHPSLSYQQLHHKPNVVFEEQPQKPAVVSTFSISQSTTPAPLEAVVPIHPVQQPSFSYQQIHHKPQGYAYDKPDVVFEEQPQKPAVVSTFSISQPTIPPPLEAVVPIQPVQYPSISYQQLHHKSQGYVYDKPDVVFEEQPQKPAVVSTFSISQPTAPAPLEAVVPIQPVQQPSFSYQQLHHKSQGYVYDKPDVVIEEQPQKPSVVSTFSISQPTTPAPFEAVVPIQPVQQPSFSYQQLHHKSQGYVYDKPDVVFEEQPQKPSVVSTFSISQPTTPAPLEAVEAIQHVEQPSFNYQQLHHKSQGYVYDKPDVVFEELPQKPSVVSTFSISQPTTPVPLDTVVPVQQPSFSYQQLHHKSQGYGYKKPTVVFEEQPQKPISGFTISQPVITDDIAQVQPAPIFLQGYQHSIHNANDYLSNRSAVYFEQRPHAAVVSGGYNYVSPVVLDQKPILQAEIQKTVQQIQPVRTGSSYSYQNIQNSAHSQNYDYSKSTVETDKSAGIAVTVAPIATYTLQQPAEFQKKIEITPVVAHKTIDTGYVYPEPSVQFVEEPSPVITNYENLEPVREEPFIAKKAYVTGYQKAKPNIIESYSISSSPSYDQTVHSTPKPPVTFASTNRPIFNQYVLSTPRPSTYSPVIVEDYYISSTPKPTYASVVSAKTQPITEKPLTFYSYDSRLVSTPKTLLQPEIVNVPVTQSRPISRYSFSSLDQKYNLGSTPISIVETPIIQDTHVLPESQPVDRYSLDQKYNFGSTPVSIVESAVPVTVAPPQSRPISRYSFNNFVSTPATLIEQPVVHQVVTPVPAVLPAVAVTQSKPISRYSFSSLDDKYNNYESNHAAFVDRSSTPAPVSVYPFGSSQSFIDHFSSAIIPKTLVTGTRRHNYVSTVPTIVTDDVSLSVPIITTTSRPISRYSFSSLDDDKYAFTPSTDLSGAVDGVVVSTPKTLVEIPTATPAYLPPESYEAGYNRFAIKSRRPVKVVKLVRPKSQAIVKVNDFHPLLAAKLGAQCTCVSNTLSLKKKPVRVQIYDEYDDVEEYVVKPDSNLDVINNDYTNLLADSDLQQRTKGVVVEDYKFEPEKVVEITPIPEVIQSTSVLPDHHVPVVVRKRLRVRPYLTTTTAYDELPVTRATDIFFKSTAVPSIQIIDGAEGPDQKDVEDVVRKGLNLIKSAAKQGTQEALTEHMYDRFGPGGIRSRDDTLQGIVDCQRAGLFRHPNHCNKFYACRWDCTKNRFTLHIFNCPVHLTFDNNLGACNWPSQGPACLGNTLLPSE